MIIIPADYNAATMSGSLRLNFDDSSRALKAINARAGDYVWVSDGEVLVGAQLEIDRDYGLVALPHWRTLVHLDDYQEVNFPSFLNKLSQMLQSPGRTLEEEAELFQLLIVFDQIAPPDIKKVAPPGHLPYRAAGALLDLDEPHLALTLLEQALAERPHDPNTLFLYLDVLRQIEPRRAAPKRRPGLTSLIRTRTPWFWPHASMFSRPPPTA